MFPKGSLLLVAFLSSASEAKATQDGSSLGGEIVVTARKKSKISSLDHYDAKSISDMGALTIGELLTKLERRNGGRSLSILINGKRLADVSDIKEIPAEALQELDILDRANSGKYGLPSQDGIVNLVLKPKFNSIPLDASVGESTEGGGGNGSAGLRYVHLGNERRFNGSVNIQRSSALYGADRKNLLLQEQNDPLVFYRTLFPSSQSTSVSGGAALPLGNISTNISLAITDADSRILNRFFNAGGTAPSEVGAVQVRGIVDDSRVQSYRLSATASGGVGRATWTMELTGNHQNGRVSSAISPLRILASGSDTLLSLPRSFQPLSTASRSSSFDAALSGNAPLIKLPAGEVMGNLRVSGSVEHMRSSAQADPAHPGSFVQRRSRAHVGLDLPLTRSPQSFVGQTSLSVNADYEQISGIGGLPAYDLSFLWQLSEGLSLNLGRSVSKAQPTLARNLDPVTYTPGVLFVDAMSGQFDVVTLISGGAPNLRASTQTSESAQVTWNGKLYGSNISVSIEYSATGTKNPVIQAGYTTAMFQSLFPRNFIRNDSGRLSFVDVRPFNGKEELRQAVRPNIHAAGGFAGEDGHWDFSLSHEWVLSAQLDVDRSVTSIDLLKTPLDGAQGVPRHRSNISATASYRRFNVQIDAQWRARNRTEDLSSSQPRSLRFGSFWTSDATVSYTFRNLKILGEQDGKPLRVWLSVKNIFNKRQTVTDSGGAIPAASQQAFIDPIGRTLALRLSTAL